MSKRHHQDNYWHEDSSSSDHHHDNHWHDDTSSSDHHNWKKHKCDHKDHHDEHCHDDSSSFDHHDWKKHKRCFDLFPGSPCCDDRFAVRLAGLEGGLNFRLRQLIGEEIELFVQAPEQKIINGVIVEVGGDFIELKPTKTFKHFSKETTIVSFENIAKLIVKKSKKRKHNHHDKHDKHDHETITFNHFHKPGCLCADCKERRRTPKNKKKFL